MNSATGKRRRITQDFLKAHPTCCFCGGHTISETIDHIPARSMFENKIWPEGYEFPACKQCQSLTRQSEQVINVLSRFYPDSGSDSAKEEMLKYLQGVNNNRFDALLAMQASSENYSKYPTAINVADPTIKKDLNLFSIKLACALHYKHTKSIIPKNGAIFSDMYTNIAVFENTIDQRIFENLTIVPKISRQNKDLSDQFYYQGELFTDGETRFFVSFRQSFCLNLVIIPDINKVPDFAKERILNPFEH